MSIVLAAHFRVGVALLALCLPSAVAQQTKGADPMQKEVPMAAGASPSFEVATVRPSDPNDPRAEQGWTCESDSHRPTCKQMTVLDLIAVMYGLQPRQIVGGPPWMSHDRYDISGIPDRPGEPNPDQVRAMFQKLLAERFHLVLRAETREMPVYALTVAKGGPLLQPTKRGEPVNAGNSGDHTQRTMRFTNMSMAEFAHNMDLLEDRPVVDQTALTSRYDFTLKWTYDLTAEAQPGAPPPLFTALKEQLGLRLDAVKGRAPVMIVDRLDRPDGN
jgi:uncharacterized protein (TIGR03435 family)